MKISEQWLREWVNPALDTAALAHQLTMAGLEVDAVTPAAGAFTGVVVAEILRAEPHPEADRLRVCEVDCGAAEPVQIVCGAPNARAGLKAPLATVGASLPGDLRIRRAKLRGVASEGMLCAEQELGLSEADAGLMELPADAPVGENLRAWLGLEDQIIEVDLTPNRADCLGMAGIAREVALLNDLPLCAPSIEAAQPASDASFAVRVSAPERCPRYVGRVLRDVDLSRPSPVWLQERLRRAGLRSIDPAVDVTNYVMLELGQPMHAFDLERLRGGIEVRCADGSESIELLNGQTLTPRPDTLLIADAGGPLALAGIMGGEGSGVAAGTRHLFLESAFFSPLHLSGQARSYGLHTDSSHRFERGVDPMLQRRALERATALLQQIIGGTAGPVIEVSSAAHLPRPATITLRAERIERMLGVALPAAEVERILRGLGIEASPQEHGWHCVAPSWRFDLRIEADLLEELARVHGYHRLPTTRIRADLNLPRRSEGTLGLPALRRQLVSRGYREAITYSFIDPKLQELFAPGEAAVRLQNPISSDMAVMRTSLLPGLLLAAQRNLNRQQGRIRLFETGQRFQPRDDGLAQEPTLALLLLGEALPERWCHPRDAVDFYHLKGDVENLFALGRNRGSLRFSAARRPALHPGRCADIHLGDTRVGYLGALHPQTQAALDITPPVYVAEIALSALTTAHMPAFAPVSRYPEVRRDLALLVDRALPAAELLQAVREQAGPYCTELTLFDVYEGKGIDPQRKSIALGLTFRDQSRTLADEEVSTAIAQVVDSLREKFKAELRS